MCRFTCKADKAGLECRKEKRKRERILAARRHIRSLCTQKPHMCCPNNKPVVDPTSSPWGPRQLQCRGVPRMQQHTLAMRRPKASEHLTVKGSAELPPHAAQSCPAHGRLLHCMSLLLCWPSIVSCISPGSSSSVLGRCYRGFVGRHTQSCMITGSPV